MLSTALRFVKRRDEAEDVVQDCFIKGFQKIHQLQDDANLGAWLKRIVVNKSLDSIREKAKIQFTDEPVIIEDKIEEEDNIESTVSVEFVKQCINQLKEKYRLVLVLYMIEDYNHREIGELLQIKESTVRNQYKRGKAQLLQLIKNNN